MESIDWSLAPDGATHYNKELSCPWIKETPPSYYYAYDGCWFKYKSDDAYAYWEAHFNNAVKRPQEWDGCGVPPVGTMCEYLWSDGDEWRKCEVVAHHLSRVVAVDTFDSSAVCQIASLFRPIKTPKQIAAEERNLAIDEMLSSVDRYSTFKDVMAVLYDAGYRKT